MARAAHLGLSKLRSYSSKIREIPAYLAAVVLDPRQKWDYFELGIEQGDWTQTEVQLAREIVQQLWIVDYKEQGLNSLAGDCRTAGLEPVEPRVSNLDDAEEHHRQWQAKRRRITPGIHSHIILLLLGCLGQLTY